MTKTRKSVLIVCITLLVLLVPLWLCNDKLIKGESFVNSDPDSLLYYRIVDQAYQKGSEKYLDYDNYGNFPYSFKIGYPRFYYWLFYSVKSICTKFFPSHSEFLIGLFPVVTTSLVALIIVIAFWYLKYPLVFLLFTAFMLIPTSPALQVGSFAQWDYDHILSLYIWLWLISAMFFQDTGNKKILYFGGIFAGLILGSWIGSLLIFFVVTIFCFILWFFNSTLCKRYLPFCYTTIGIAAILNSLIMLLNPSRYGYVLLDFGIIHISAMFLASLGIYTLTKFNPSKKSKILFIIISAIVIAGFALIDPVDTKDLIEKVTGVDPIFLEINELQPLIRFSQIFVSLSSIEMAIKSYGLFLVLFPLFLFIPAQKLLKHNSALLMQYWLIIVAFASFYQNRYTRIFGIGSCIFVAFILYFLWKNITIYIANTKLSKIKIFFTFVLLLLLARTSSVWSLFTPTKEIRKSEVEAYNWIKNNTPKTSGYYDTQKPEYAILAYWDYGNHINYFAQRPVIANNMQNGVKNMADIFSSTDEETANNICEELNIKYVFMTPDRVLYPSTIDYWPAYKKFEKAPGYRALPYKVERSKDYDKWFYSWLLKDFGLRKRYNFDPTSNFRIIFANSENTSPSFSTMLFERVKGAKLVLKGKPNTIASVNFGLKVNKKFFNYHKESKINENGYVTFILPYSCYYNNGIVSTGELFEISLISDETGRKKTGKVSIKEKDVIAGNQVATNSIILFN